MIDSNQSNAINTERYETKGTSPFKSKVSRDSSVFFKRSTENENMGPGSYSPDVIQLTNNVLPIRGKKYW